MLSSESYQRVIDKFMQSLENGTLKPNDKIYSENQLARILNIPRAQVREVYAALSILGILYGQQGKGTFLGSGDMRQNTEILYLMTLSINPNYREMAAVRHILELGAAPMAAANRTEADLAFLRLQAEKVVEDGDIETLSEYDAAFHNRLIQASGNPLLHCLFQIVSVYMSRIIAECWQRSENFSEIRRVTIMQHQDMVDALEARDSAALIALLDHHFKEAEQFLGSSAD